LIKSSQGFVYAARTERVLGGYNTNSGEPLKPAIEDDLKSNMMVV